MQNNGLFEDLNIGGRTGDVRAEDVVGQLKRHEIPFLEKNQRFQSDIRAMIEDSKDKIPLSNLSGDNNPDLINESGERPLFTLGDDSKSQNQIGLVQEARQSLSNEINKFNVKGQDIIPISSVSQPNKLTLDEFLETQAGRALHSRGELSVQDPSVPAGAVRLASGRIVDLQSGRLV